MKVTADRRAAADAAKWVARALPNPKTVYNAAMLGIVVTADDHGLTLAASDYDLDLRATVAAEVGEPGTVLLPGVAVASYLGVIRGESVTVEAGERSVLITSGRSRSSLHQLDPTNYPSPPPEPKIKACVVGADELRRLVSAVIGHADGGSSVPWYGSVNLMTLDGRLAVACGTRYALGMARGDNAADERLSVLVRADQLGTAIGGLSGLVTVMANDGTGGTLALRTDDQWAQLRIVDEQYPDILPMFNRGHTGEVTADRAELAAAVTMASTGTDRVRLIITHDQIDVESWKPEQGELTQVITAEVACVATEPAKVIMDSRYLSTALGALVGDSLTLQLGRGVVLTDGLTRHAIGRIHPAERS